jgi:hypothetical protein
MSRKLFALAFGLIAFNLLFFSFRSQTGFGLNGFGFGSLGFFVFIFATQVFLFLLYHPHLTFPLSKRSSLIIWSGGLAVATSFLTLFRANPIDQSVLSIVALSFS